MRLDKLISNCGFGSRKEVKAMMKRGLVTVDDCVVKKPETHVDPTLCKVCVGEHIIEYEKYSYLMMNKPAGIISATFDEVEQTVCDLLEDRYIMGDVFPVGRLDKDTTGLLILSNDGGFAHRALSPKKKVDKVYHAKLDKPIGQAEIKAFAMGVTLDDGYKTLPAHLTALDDAGLLVEITIREGKYHQIKRMFEVVDNRVLELKRVSFAGILLDENLAPGEYRRLNEEELALIDNLLSKD